MNKCPVCGTEYEGSFCPNGCNSANFQQQKPKKKNRGCLIAVLAVVGVIVLGILAIFIWAAIDFAKDPEANMSSYYAMSSQKAAEKAAESELAAQEKAESDAAAASQAAIAADNKAVSEAKKNGTYLYGINETGVGKDCEVTVTNMEATQGNNQFDRPADGKEFIVVTVKIKNISNRNQYYNPFDFKMQNGSGQIESQALTTVDNDTSLSSGQLAPGGEVTGTIAFEEPIGTDLILLYNIGLISDKPELQFKIR